ncbi:MAG: CPBP family glutamic-type intramembrane protease [Nitrososphaerota archaeon]
MSRARLRASTGTGGWTPMIDSLSILLIVIAFFSFLYFAIAYRYLEIFFKPAIVMLAMLSAGLSLGVTLAGARVTYSFMSLTAATAGLLSALGLFGIQLVVGLVNVPAQGVMITMSPFWIVLLYFSVGVAEESAFTLTMFGSMVRAGINPLLATFVKSAFFVTYHNFVAIQMFSKPIFQVTSYSLVLYIGSVLLTLAFYVTRLFSVPALGHGLLNAFVQIQALSGGV